MTEKIKNRISEEIGKIKKELSVPEYAFWWVCRIWLLIVLIKDLGPHAEDGHYNLQMISNLMLTFVLPLLHFVFGEKTLFGRLSHHANTVAVIMVFATCVLGLHYTFYGIWFWYDSFLHFITGVVMVWVGMYVMNALGAKDMTPLVSSATGFGLSCFTSLFWEFYEFNFDNLTGQCTQAWDCPPSDIFYKVFPNGALDSRVPLIDTMTDLSLGLIGAVIGGIILRIITEKKLKKSK